MNFYTISLEYLGSTYISQVWADDEASALMEWAIQINVKKIKGIGIGKQIKQRIIDELKQGHDHNKLVLLNGTVNVWSAALLIRSKMLFINVIKTVT